MPKVACIIVNYKNTEDTCALLHSLKRLKNYDCLEVFIVDNESSPNSRSQLESIKDINLIASKENLGFAGGVNLAIRSAAKQKPDFYWLINSDCTVDPDCLEELVKAAKKRKNAIVGSLVLYDKHYSKVWFAGGKLYLPWFIVQHLGKGKPLSSLNLGISAKEVSFLTGCSMLISRKLITQIGALDDSFFLYGEDVDLCMKAKELGSLLYIQPTSVVWHKVSRGSGGEFNALKEYYNTRNGYFLISRYINPLPKRLLAYLTRSIWDIYRIACSLRNKKSSPLKAWKIYCKALTDFYYDKQGKIDDSPAITTNREKLRA